jgi:hypothetical protein
LANDEQEDHKSSESSELGEFFSLTNYKRRRGEFKVQKESLPQFVQSKANEVVKQAPYTLNGKISKITQKIDRLKRE